MKCSMCGKDHLWVTVTQTQRELHEGSGGTEEAFTSRAQQAMLEYHDVITAVMWANYTGNHD